MIFESDIPTVALYNNLEVFYKFLKRSDDIAVLERRMYRGDRGIFWLGKKKLLIVTKAIPDATYICNRWGYLETDVCAPKEPSTHQLSLDVLRDQDLMRKIVDYAGPKKQLRLIPYASTPEFYTLAQKLHFEFDLKIFLPESPSETNLWIRDYIDTKAGFRSIVSGWITEGNIIPHGFVCRDIKQAARAVKWFNDQGLGAVVKADGGESGMGHLVFSDKENTIEEILNKLAANPFLDDDIIVVDQFIASKSSFSPSLELFIPAGKQPPLITYLSRQLFSEFGRFSGVLISREVTHSEWYPRLASYGLKIAGKLQELGYVGHFDIDAIVDDDGNLYLLEINARRTGGTYVHEFATLTFGENYIDKVCLLCNNSVKCEGVGCVDELTEIIGDLLFPIQGQNRGIVITVTSSLSMGEFGCILIAPNEKDLLVLEEEMHLRLKDG